MLTFTMYKDKKGEWRWRLQARNKRIVADSGEGYSNKAKCKRAILRVANATPRGSSVYEIK